MLSTFITSLLTYRPKVPVGVSKTDAHTATWDWQTSVGLALLGAAGSGKTTAMVHITSILAATGCRFLVYDPHYPHQQSFAAQAYPFIEPLLLAPILTEPDHMVPFLRLLPTLSKARIPPLEFSIAPPPVMLIMDEVSALIAQLDARWGDEKENPLDAFVQSLFEVRKMNVRVLVAGQQWTQLGKYSAALRKHLAFLVKRTADTVAWQSVITLDKPLLKHHKLPTNPAQLPVDLAFWQYDCIKTGRLSRTGLHIAAQRANVWKTVYDKARTMTYQDWKDLLPPTHRASYAAYQQWRALHTHIGGWYGLPLLSYI